MKFGILGTGTVGKTIGTKLVSLGHDVKMGSRSANNERAISWSKGNGKRASHGTLADAAAFGDVLFNCTSGVGSLDALKMAGAGNLKGKILVDIANPLDFSKGMPPTLTVCNTDSLGERIQEQFPECKVVKSLNTMNAEIMVNPNLLAEEHTVFVNGNDKAAKTQVTDLLKTFGWRSVLDLGDITASRGVEMILPIWLRILGATGTGKFNFRIVK